MISVATCSDFAVNDEPALAYSQHKLDDGTPIYWPQPVLELAVDASVPGDGTQAIVDAAEAWRGIEHVPAIRIVAAAKSSVVWVDDWTGKASDLASTKTWIHEDGGISRVVIYINGAKPWSFDMSGPDRAHFDFESTMVHELGHALGLEHSEDRGAVMWPDMSRGMTARAPSPDDEAGIADTYGWPREVPPPVFAVPPYPACDVVHAGAPRPSNAAGTLFWALLVYALARVGIRGRIL